MTTPQREIVSRKDPSRKILVILTLISGVMLGVSFPPSPFGALAAFGLIPLLFLYELTENYARPLRYTYAAFVVWHVLSVYWMGGFVHGRDGLMMLGGALLLLVNPIFLLVPVIAYLFVRRTLSLKVALVFLPFIWVGFEYIRGMGDLAFPWMSLGNTQAMDIVWSQFITFTGVYGLSFWVLIINIIGFVLVYKIARREWYLPCVQVIGTGLSIIVIYFTPYVYGSGVLSNAEEYNEKVRVGIVQPDVDPFQKWDFDRAAITDQLLEQSSSLLPDNPDMIVLPENAIPYYLLLPQNRRYYDKVRSFIEDTNVPILAGVPHSVMYDSPDDAPPAGIVIPGTDQPYASYNAAVLIDPGTDEIDFYGKIVLVPFVERVPYADVLLFAKKIRRSISIGGWDVGQDTTVFQIQQQDYTSDDTAVRTLNFGTVICYESAHPGFVRHFTHNGADFLVVITNDSWWGKTAGPYQHAQLSVLRAIENRRSIARAANGGISSFIDPYGRILKTTPLFEQTEAIHDIPVFREMTFHARNGDVFAIFSLIIGAFSVAIAVGIHVRRLIFKT